MKIPNYIGLVILLSPFICHADEAGAGSYRSSWKFENEILYISQNFAITRSVNINRAPTNIYYSLDKAKYDGLPEFSKYTGDVGDALVKDIRQMSWDKEKQIFFGIGSQLKNKKLATAYFIFDGKNKKIVFFVDKEKFDKHLRALGVKDNEMFDMELQFRFFVREIGEVGLLR